MLLTAQKNIRPFCLLFFFLAMSFLATAQNVTFKGENVPLKKVFTVIEKQTQYTFFYKSGLLKNASKVTVNFQNTSLHQALELLFSNQPFTYSIVDRMITLEAKQEIPKGNGTITVTVGETVNFPAIAGYVQEDSTFKILEAVTVTVSGTGKSTMTDARGYFTLKNVDANAVLTFSCIGYTKRVVPVDGQPVLYVHLKPAVTILDQAIIQAYGTTSRRLATGNITKVTAAEIAKQPVMNPLLALQGRVPGLTIRRGAGFASSEPMVAIRGINNLAKHTNPLYIIDNVPIPEIVGQLSNNVTTGRNSPLFNINPKDIESIEVLKDADATAIYGSRGANGVILITTKKGKQGPTQFSFGITQGVTRISRYWDMLSTPQYLQMRREAFANDGIVPTTNNAADLLLWDTTRYTNWQKALWGGMGKLTSINAGLTAGDQQNIIGVNVSYDRATDITRISGSTQRANVQLSVSHKTVDQKLSLSLTSNYSYSKIDVIQGSASATLAPNAPPILDKNGNPNWAEWNANGLLDLYPFSSWFTSNPQVSNFLNSSFSLGYTPIKGLTISTTFGHNLNISNSTYLGPITSKNPFKVNTGDASFNIAKSSSFIIEPQINYNTIIGKSTISVLVGGSLQSSTGNSTYSLGTGYTDDNLIQSINNAAVVMTNDSYTQYKYAGVFTRIMYNYDNKYVVNLNGRRDGSSRFGPGRQYGNFGSAGVAWILSEEKWLKRNLPEAISFIKLRGSYGTTGSDGVGDYQYLSLWSTYLYGVRLPKYDGDQAYGPYNPPNQNYHWDSNNKLEGALEIGLLRDNRLFLTVSYYRTRTKNQISTYPLPSYTGFTGVLANMPANIQNTGVEVSLDARLISTPNFSWRANFNISTNRNKLVSFPELSKSPYANLYLVGKPLSTQYLIHYIGVDPLTGNFAFEDYNKDGNIIAGGGPITEISTNNDNYIEIDPSPRYFGGFGTSFSYKGLSLSLMFNYVKQRGTNAYAVISGNAGKINYNVSPELYNNHWQKSGDVRKYAAFRTQGNSMNTLFGQSDGVYTDASFVRLNNVNIAYSLPVRWLKKAGIKGCSFSVSAQNIFVITNYEGLDPEAQLFGVMPLTKAITGGLSFNF